VDAGEAADADYAAMEELARDSPKVVAIGEIGLDFFRNLSPPDAQVSAFRRQLRLARRLGKPVILHDILSPGAISYMKLAGEILEREGRAAHDAPAKPDAVPGTVGGR